ncbi:MAG: hypothetical protein IJU64_06245 [Bacilli bacterium]|nr:hypothetical protein [Bacilli bacterium]
METWEKRVLRAASLGDGLAVGETSSRCLEGVSSVFDFCKIPKSIIESKKDDLSKVLIDFVNEKPSHYRKKKDTMNFSRCLIHKV